MLASDTACLASHGPTDTGWGQVFSGILTAFAIYAAVKNAETAYKVAKKESQMATRYYNLSKDLLEYYKDNCTTYRLGRSGPFVFNFYEVGSDPIT